MRSFKCRSAFAAGCAVSALLGCLAARSSAQDGPPRVIRTMTHHQVTAVERGVSYRFPVVADGGSRILYSYETAPEGRMPRLATIPFEGGPPATVAEGREVGEADISADGSRVAYVFGRKDVVVANADGTGRRTVVSTRDADINAVRISGDGRTVVFLCTRGFYGAAGNPPTQYERGVFAASADGGGFRRVAGATEVARLRGVTPDDIGINFGLQFSPGSVDVSTDGRRIAFGCWAKSTNALFGCDGDGRNLHTIAEGKGRVGGSAQEFDSLALSGDGTTVAYHTLYPEVLGIVGFDGKGEKTLAAAGPDARKLTFPSSCPVHVTLDGGRVTFRGRHFDVAGGGSFDLMSTHQEALLRYWSYTDVSPDALGRRFAYWPREPEPVQLATMELNVPWDRLRGAPKVSDLLLDPPVVPRKRPTGDIARPRLSARVAADPATLVVSGTGFLAGVSDDTMTQGGQVDLTRQYDDGKTADNGDPTAGDGVYTTNRWVSVYPDAPDGPRTIRVEAQVVAADKLRHATVIEIGPYPIVPGTDELKPTGTPPIVGTPPAPPTVTTTGTPVTEAIPPGPADPKTPKPIDLTGYWKSENGGPHTLRQIGKSVYWKADALPVAQNIFFGTIAGDVLTGTWIDLPGGRDYNTGTLSIKIDSNDKLTKLTNSPVYGAVTWTRTAPPAGLAPIPTGPGPVTPPPVGPGPVTPPPVVTGPIGVGPGAKAEPWQTPEGRAAIDQWVAEAMGKINAYKGTDAFNARKPWSINKYGLLEGKGITSAFAPDNFKDYGNDRYHYMWDYWVPSATTGWRYPEWNAAAVPPLRAYVNAKLAK